jgi:hypothetical protein
MPRKCNPDLTIDWKVVLPAHLAGAVEHELMGPGGRPRYGERSRLIGQLLAVWLAGRGRHVPVDSPPSPDLYTPTAPLGASNGN